MKERIRVDTVDHICVLVSDIEKSLERVRQVFEVPPVKVEEHASTARLRGRDLGRYRIKLAMVELAENLVIEFLQVVEGESVELDWLKRHGETIHHLAVKVDDMEKEAERWGERGIRILQEDHGKWIYLDTEEILGLNVELVP